EAGKLVKMVNLCLQTGTGLKRGVNDSEKTLRCSLMTMIKSLLTAILIAGFLVLSQNPQASTPHSAQAAAPQTTAQPSPAPARWRPLIGEYTRDKETVIVLESDGKLCALFNRVDLSPMRELSDTSFEFLPSTKHAGEQASFSRNSSGRVMELKIGQ